METTQISFEQRMTVQNPDLIQLYSIATANGIKAAACLEELISVIEEEGGSFDYEPHSIDIRHEEHKSAKFTDMNPNRKIPVIVDPHGENSHPVTVFESGAILMYLAEKYKKLLPTDVHQRADAITWLFWGSSSFSVQVKQFGFYFKYCPHSLPYCVNRYRKSVQELLVALNTQLSHSKPFITGDMYTVADIAIWPWIYALHEFYDEAIESEFHGLVEVPFVKDWYQCCMDRPASKKSLEVCRFVFPDA